MAIASSRHRDCRQTTSDRESIDELALRIAVVSARAHPLAVRPRRARRRPARRGHRPGAALCRRAARRARGLSGGGSAAPGCAAAGRGRLGGRAPRHRDSGHHPTAADRPTAAVGARGTAAHPAVRRGHHQRHGLAPGEYARGAARHGRPVAFRAGARGQPRLAGHVEAGAGGRGAGRPPDVHEPRLHRRGPPHRAGVHRAAFHGRLLGRLQGGVSRCGRYPRHHAVPRRPDDRAPEIDLGRDRRQPDPGAHSPRRRPGAGRLLHQRHPEPAPRHYPLLLRRRADGARCRVPVLARDGDGGMPPGISDRRDHQQRVSRSIRTCTRR